MINVIIPCYLIPDKDNELTKFTMNCIESLQKTMTHPYRVVIVDNGSPISVDYLQSVADVYIRNDENLGYAKAVNQGLQASMDADWIVVSNNDIEFLPDWFEHMSGAWDESTGVVSSHLHDNDLQHKAGVQIAHVGLMFGALWLTKPCIVAEIGLLDENFERGMFEDKDIWQRVLAAGYTLKKAGWCNHVGNATWGKLPNQQEIYIKNKDYYHQKWGIK